MERRPRPRGPATPGTGVLRVLPLAILLIATPALATPGDLAPYAKARVAEADDAVAAAARDYAVALAADPDSPVVAIRAYREAVRAGDLALADRAAAVLAAQGIAPSDAALLTGAKAARDRDPRAATAAIARLDTGQLRILAAPLRAWAAFDAGTDPLAALATRPAEAVARRFVEETRALVLIAMRRTDEGIVALTALAGNDQASQDNRIAAARLLIAQGSRDRAIALLTGDEPAVVALRVRPTDGARPSLAFGASHLFARVASDLALGDPGPLSYTLAQAALRADPANGRARLLLAGALAKDGAVDHAVETLSHVAENGIYARVAAAGTVQILAAAGRSDAALSAARAGAARADAGPDDIRRLADLFTRLDRPADAAPLYKSLIGPASDWSAWLQYGAALDGAGRWAEARPALERALALGPNEPLVLNYLGYSLVEQRENMDVAQAMLERVAALSPDDPAITDSLGWSFYQRGQIARALPLLERAAAGDPANAEIGEHLGDAYWRAGRRYEARYAWVAARQVANTVVSQRLASKISDGL